MDAIKPAFSSPLVRCATVLILSLIFTTDSSALFFRKFMFYDENQNPLYLSDVFPDSSERSLARAVINGNVEAVRRAVDRSKDINFQGLYGVTLLWLAVQNNHVDIVKILLDNGADPDVPVEGMSSIVGRAAEQYPEILAMLLSAGASTEVRSGSFGKWAPIHFAATRKQSDSLELVVEAGADLNAKTEAGGTALSIAALFGRLDNVIYLLEAGADPLADPRRHPNEPENTKEDSPILAELKRKAVNFLPENLDKMERIRHLLAKHNSSK